MIEELAEVQLPDKDAFLKIAETLTRIGIRSGDTLTQTCHILHKRGHYYICHYLEMFRLDGFDRVMTNDDIDRRNAVVALLAQWGLCTPLTAIKTTGLSKMTVVPHNQKAKYTLKSNYTVGKKKKPE